MSSIHKHYFLAATLAAVGATILVAALDKTERPALVKKVNPNGDMIVDFLDTEKEERVWVATREKLPSAEEHAAALRAEEKAFQARVRAAQKKSAPDSPEVARLRAELDELKAQVAAFTAKKR